MPAPHPVLVALAALALGGCGVAGNDEPADIALIEGSLRIADPTRDRIDDSDRSLLSALAKGLVGFDPDGRVDQGLAMAWTVTDDGLSYIFRLSPARWTDGTRVTSRDVAAILTARIATASRNRLRHEAAAIESIRAMTDDVIEIRLTRPSSDLLDLLAQPEFAIATKRRGWGPLRASDSGGHWSLAAAPDPLAPAATAAEADRAPLIAVGVHAPANALARFRLGAVDAVIGGRYQHFPYFLASGIAVDRLVIDPARGLFGLGFVEETGFFAAAQNRGAIAKAIDRAALLTALGIEGWQPQVAMRPQYKGQPSDIEPVLPLWSDQGLPTRRVEARQTVAEWRAAGGAVPVVRIALPDGIGSRILFASLKADLAAIGLDARHVALFADADLRLIDQVAPSDNPLWVVHRLSCDGDVICDAAIEEKLARADATDDVVARNALLAEIDAELTRYVPYIPLATPLRWALVDRRITGYRANVRARHPLDRLVEPR